MTDLTCDVAIIGAGTAGLAAERSARRAGARTLLIDPAFAGTTCARYGCMPSKLLIAAGEAAHATRAAGTFGVRVAKSWIDGAAVMTRVRALRDAFVQGVVDGLDDLPAHVRVKAKARFVAPTRLALDDGRTLSAKTMVIATGSRPALPEPFATMGERVLTNETIFDMPDLPRSIAVIGAGPLGLELAQALARLDVAVTLFDEGTTLAGLADEPEIAACLHDILATDMVMHLGVEVTPHAVSDGIRIAWRGDEDSGEAVFDRVLLAVGRPPNLAGLDLQAAGIACDDHGTPLFDETTMQCGDSPVFIAGDADHARPVLHEASHEGAIAGRNAACFPDLMPARRCILFSIMFTDPPLARIGEPGKADVTGTASYADQGRARMMATNHGLAHIHADPADGRLTAATLLAPDADHLGHLLAWSMEGGATASDLLDRPFYHPTYEEGLKPALRAICATVGAKPPAERDEGDPAGG